MVYIDGTEQSITAAHYAVCLARYNNAQLLACYVVNTKALEDLLRASIFLKEEQIEFEHDLSEDAQRYLRHVTELARAKNQNITTLSRSGIVSQEIVSVIREEHVDLLVIGELSRIRSRRDELYNETDRAMRSAPCSVLVVKDDERVLGLYESLV
jgi:nucleotide-binding universal stress UspA family protein